MILYYAIFHVLMVVIAILMCLPYLIVCEDKAILVKYALVIVLAPYLVIGTLLVEYYHDYKASRRKE